MRFDETPMTVTCMEKANLQKPAPTASSGIVAIFEHAGTGPNNAVWSKNKSVGKIMQSEAAWAMLVRIGDKLIGITG